MIGYFSATAGLLVSLYSM